MKKIYNINFWYTRHNYGANLTAYALQTVLRQLGYDFQLINNPLKISEAANRRYTFSFNFQKQYLNTTKYTDKNLEFLNNDGNCFITGSDQVFRPKYMRGKPEQYLLDFVKPDKAKIAFSASFGINKEQFTEENTKETIEHMKKSLQSFDFISVREKSGIEICKDLFGTDAEWIIDPVFILEKEKYDKLIENSTTDCKNKIVFYVLDTNDEYDKVYEYFENKYNKPVIKTANSNISIEDWLASIRDCDLFVTDSFHGMCFAVIFNKPFICLANKNRGGSRFESICEMLGIDYQCIESISEVVNRDCVFKVDYDKVNQRIETERKKGLDFLDKALNAPIKITQEKIDARYRYLEEQILELDKRDNIKYQIKKLIWDNWLIIYSCYLPNYLKRIISFFWHMIKGVVNACRK